MKLRLPSLLATAILATFTSLTASAAVVGTGVSYDNGKGSDPYSKDPAAHTLPGNVQTDILYCWANSAANMIQYWQDSYREVALDQDAAPNGYNATVYNQPYGTRYLNVYEYYLQHGNIDKGGYQDEAINWYFRQTPIKDGTLAINETSFMKTDMGAPDVISKDYSGGLYKYESPQDALSDLTTTLETVFSKQGQAVGLAIWQQDPADADREWGDFQSRSHAVTCWGYEKDAEGNVNALYLSDSDDMAYGVFKVHLTLGQSVPLGGMPSWDAILLQTDDQIDGYSGFVVNLSELFAISPDTGTTPEEGVTAYKDYVQNATPLPKLTSAEGEQTVKVLVANTIVSGAVSRTGAGVQVGKDAGQAAPDIVMLVSEDAGSSLTLTGDYDKSGTGLDVKLGSLASVANLDVSGYERGVEAQGKVYLYGEMVNVNRNALSNGDGAGIHNTNYVEIKDATEVNITGNSATSGRGGGIYNGENATTSIRDNAEVIFSGNTAAQGNDIYNAKGGSVNIADNGSVAFKGQNGEAAIVNDGTLYLKSGTDDRGISFQDASLDSRRGITYVGQDINGAITETSLKFADDTKTLTEISAKDTSLPAVLKEVKVGAAEIIGTGAGTASLQNSAVSCAADLRLSHLTLDASSKFTGQSEGKLTLDNLVIDLSGFEMSGEYAPEFDISGMFTGFGSMTVNSVYLDASSFELYENWDEYYSFVSVNFGEMLNDGTRLAVLIGNDMMTQNFEIDDRGNVMFWGEVAVPEPATGTLGLLALAGLAARRRRK